VSPLSDGELGGEMEPLESEASRFEKSRDLILKAHPLLFIFCKNSFDHVIHFLQNISQKIL
jgi:hypothetical protein